MIFQILAATVMGVVVAFQSVRVWVVNVFRTIFGRKQKEVDSVAGKDSAVDRSTELEER